jgi:hypothetical protein
MLDPGVEDREEGKVPVRVDRVVREDTVGLQDKAEDNAALPEADKVEELRPEEVQGRKVVRAEDMTAWDILQH